MVEQSVCIKNLIKPQSSTIWTQNAKYIAKMSTEANQADPPITYIYLKLDSKQFFPITVNQL